MIMALFKRIVVAIDGSSVAKIALREAIKLAKDQQSALRIVFVVDVVPPSAESPYELDAYEDAVRRDADKVLKQAAAVARKAGVEAETVRLEVQSLQDRIADEIARNAKAWRADLLVMGTHGRRGMSRMFLGSVAESLIRIAPAPVLLIRGRQGPPESS
jgi:nucleotide-binding universal stress UspA family protein